MHYFLQKQKYLEDFIRHNVGKKKKHAEAFADFHTIKNKIYFVVYKKASIFHLQIADLNN